MSVTASTNSTLCIFHIRRGFQCLVFSMTSHILESCSHKRCKSRSEIKPYLLTCRMETPDDVILIATNWGATKQMAVKFLSLTHFSLCSFTKFPFWCLFTQFICCSFFPSSLLQFPCFPVSVFSSIFVSFWVSLSQSAFFFCCFSG
jgi:hypothetical protein